MLRRSARLLFYNDFIKCICKRNLFTTSKTLYAVHDKDLPNPFLPTSVTKLYAHDTDILLEQLKSAKTIDRNLELISMHLDVMNANHVVHCLQNIHQLQKLDNMSLKDLMANQAFQGLCSKLMKLVRLLEPNELVSAFKALSGLQIRNNSYVVQSVLKMIGSSLNEMSLSQLIFLNFILNKQRANSLVEGLKLALPLVVQVQIEQQLDSGNISEVVECLQLSCRARLKPSTIQKILTTVIEKAKMMSTDNATTTVFALLNLSMPLDGYKELLNYSFNVLSSDIESISVKQIHSLLRICRNTSTYNSKFFFSVANRVVSENWSLKDTYYVIKDWSFLNFAPMNLKDHLVKLIISESDTILTDEFISILSLAKYMVLTGYNPDQVQEAMKVLCSCEPKFSELRNKYPNLFLKLLSYVSMLGYLPNVLSEVINEDFLYESWSLSRKQGKSLDFEKNVFSLAWSIEVYDQQEKFKFPTSVLKRLTQSMCERSFHFENLLGKFLENGLGGSQFIQNGIFTQDGIFVDHILGMRSGNYPVALQTSSPSTSCKQLHFLEDVVLPADAKLVTIIVANEEQYCHDPQVLNGWMDLKIRALVKKKCYPVVINYSVWKDLPDREKIPYLMQEIKNVLQEEISSDDGLKRHVDYCSLN